MAAHANGARAPLSDTPSFANTNRWETGQFITMSLLCALSVLLTFIEFPLIPGVTWLKYDASSVPAMISGLAFGPGAGAAVGIACALIHGFLFADLAGALMNILAVVGFVLPAAALFRRRRTLPCAAGGLALSCLATTALAVVGNLLITPLWLGVPLEAVVAMIIPLLVPFNLAKALLNSILTLIVHRRVAQLVEPAGKKAGL